MTTAVAAEARPSSVKEFVARLSCRESDDIEKLLVHVLDSAVNHWNTKANRYLAAMKNPDLKSDEVAALKKQYTEAFENVNRLVRMRHGCCISKKTL